MLEAFTFMFKDTMYKRKAFTYGLLVFAMNLLIGYIGILYSAQGFKFSPSCIALNVLLFFLFLIPSGYSIICLKAFMEQKENYVIPFLSVRSSFVKGFKLLLSLILFHLVFISIVVAVALSIGILFAISKLVAIILFCLALLSLFALLIFFIICSPAFSCIFAKTEKLTTLLRFPSAVKLIKQDIERYFSCFGLYFLISIAVVIFSMIVGLVFPRNNMTGNILASLIMAIMSAYTIFVTAFLFAKAVDSENIN